jgi:broad specificity phosphatase PhoE
MSHDNSPVTTSSPRRAGARASIVWLLTAAALVWPSLSFAQQLVFVVRHAERADAGMRAAQTTASPDPPLSDAGRARADRLASMLSATAITAIYTTEFIRTQQTAAPLAAMLKVTPVTMSSKDTAAMVARVKADHPRDVVLIVGHSNTVPDIVKALGGSIVTVGDNEYDKIFVVVPATGVVTVIKY